LKGGVVFAATPAQAVINPPIIEPAKPSHSWFTPDLREAVIAVIACGLAPTTTTTIANK
jgi:hypothetical protein